MHKILATTLGNKKTYNLSPCRDQIFGGPEGHEQSSLTEVRATEIMRGVYRRALKIVCDIRANSFSLVSVCWGAGEGCEEVVEEENRKLR